MRHRQSIAMGVALGLLAAAPAALASGGGGSGAGSGGSASCAPLTMVVGVGHADSGQSSVGATATVRNCTSAPQQHLQLTVNVPGTSTVPFKASLAENPGNSITMAASPIGSTPLLLHYGQTYQVVATLTDMSTAPAAVLSSQTFSVTMPAGPVC